MGTEQSPYTKVVARAMSDPDFKQRLKDDPHAALADHGIEVPRERRINVVENTADTMHLVLPAEIEGEITDEELASVFGGGGPGDIPTGPWG